MKYSINLLQDELFPEKPLVTLPRVVLLWLVVAVAMSLMAYSLHSSSQSMKKQANELSRLKADQDAQIADLKNQLANHKADIELEAKLATLQNLMRNKKSIYSYLTNTENSYIAGYAEAMTELANIHSRNISLNQININEQQVTFSGLAKSADSVPNWLANFEQSKVLSGKSFSHFELSETELGNYLNFAVSTHRQKEGE